MKDSIGSVKLKTLKKAIKSIEHSLNGSPINDIDNIDISFEYIIGSFFPKVLDSINNRIKEEKTKSYIEGYNVGKSENDNKGIT